MLKPINLVACSPALAACQSMMQRFASWLCAPGTTGESVTSLNLQPPTLASAIEASWLWTFLQRVDAGQSLLAQAQALADAPFAEKAGLSSWVAMVSALPAQFQPGAVGWPILRPAISDATWRAFKVLMDGFFEKGFRSGLPFQANGIPTAAGGVTYADYVKDFRAAHRLNPDDKAREVCVLCGGPLGDTPHVDHWIVKSAFPLLSVCAHNLQLICSTCNEAPNKGEKSVHSAGSFAQWFHPYLRPGSGAMRLRYFLPDLTVQCEAVSPPDVPKAQNLNQLLNLSDRWTREFKAEYVKHQDVLRRRERLRIQYAQVRHTQGEIQTYVTQWQADLVPSEPHHEVHQALAAALQEPARLAAWRGELSQL